MASFTQIKLEDVYKDIQIAFETENPYEMLKACGDEYSHIRDTLLRF